VSIYLFISLVFNTQLCYYRQMTEITIDLEIARGCTVPICGRISLEMATKIKRSGKTKSVVLKEALAAYFGAAFSVGVTSASSWELDELWVKHGRYVATSETLQELEKNWEDYRNDLYESGKRVPDEANDVFFNRIKELQGA